MRARRHAEERYARDDDGLPAHADPVPGAGRHAVQGQRDRHPAAGQVAAPLPLRRLPPARPATRLGARARRSRAGRSRRHHDVEQLPARGVLLRCPLRRRGAAHAQLPPAPERHRLYRQPRGRPLRDRGRRAAAALREGPGRDRAGAGVRRGPLRPAGAGRLRELRGPAGHRRSRRRPAHARRARRLRRLLHLRHHRQAQGRRLLAPRHGAPHHDDVHDRALRHEPARLGHARGADVPRQRLGSALRGGGERCAHRPARPAPRPREPARPLPGRGGHVHRRRADDLERNPASARCRARALVARPPVPHRGRRLGGERGDDPGLRPSRGPHHPRLGHDRDDAARHRRAAQGDHAGARRGRRVRLPREAGDRSALRRHAADQRRRGRALGRRDHGRGAGARALDRRRLSRFGRARRQVVGGRLAAHRRRRHRRLRGLHEDHRPHQGPDQVRRRVDQLGRSGERAHGPSRRERGRGDRGAPREVGGAPARRHRPEGGGGGGFGRAPEPPRGRLRQVVAARRLRVRGRDSAHVDRQVPQVGAARALRGSCWWGMAAEVSGPCRRARPRGTRRSPPRRPRADRR